MGSIVIERGKMPPLSAEQLEELEKGAMRPINYDEIPPLTEEQLARLQRVSNHRINQDFSVA